MIISPANLPTENLESILIDRVGSPARLKSALKEYNKRADKNMDAALIIATVR